MVSVPDPPPAAAPPPPPPNPPTIASSAVQQSVARERQQAATAEGQGFSGTLLTGAGGSTPKNAVKTTLGGS